MTRVAFVCEGNAGRSQFATAFAERERSERGLDEAVEIATGGTQPRDDVHDEVVEVLREVDIDIGDRTPRRITTADLADAEYVVTMGCSVDEFVPAGWDGTTERWNLDHPDAGSLEQARAQRDEIEARVSDLFDRLEAQNE